MTLKKEAFGNGKQDLDVTDSLISPVPNQMQLLAAVWTQISTTKVCYSRDIHPKMLHILRVNIILILIQ